MKFTLTLFLVFFLTRRGQAALGGTCDTPEGTCTNAVANSDICTGNACICNVHYEETTPGGACQKIVCSDSSDCTADGYCDTAPTTNECKCKSNFVDTSNRACARRPCSGSDKTCFNEEAHSYCDTANECKCGFLAPADATTGACTQTSCTESTECGSGSHGAHCISGKCQCSVNKIPGATACIERECALDTDCTVNGDANSECDTSTNKCSCKAQWASVNESCRKTCSNATADCHKDAHCNTFCTCNINYEGDGGATCTQKSCTSTAECGHEDLVCDTTSSKCECKSGFETSGASCVVSTTTVQTTTGNGSTAVSLSVQLILFILGFYRAANMFE